MPILEQDVRALDVPAAVDLFEIEDLRVKIDGLLQIGDANSNVAEPEVVHDQRGVAPTEERFPGIWLIPGKRSRSEEHTSELQSQSNLVCRLLLEKKKNLLYMAVFST